MRTTTIILVTIPDLEELIEQIRPTSAAPACVTKVSDDEHHATGYVADTLDEVAHYNVPFSQTSMSVHYWR